MPRQRPAAVPAASPKMPDLFNLPPEIRNKIFKYVFMCTRFHYEHGASKNRIQTLSGKLSRFRKTATPIAILGVSKQCYTESRSMFFNTAQINTSKLIDPYYGTFSSPIVDPTLIEHVVVNL